MNMPLAHALLLLRSRHEELGLQSIRKLDAINSLILSSIFLLVGGFLAGSWDEQPPGWVLEALGTIKVTAARRCRAHMQHMSICDHKCYTHAYMV